ncbi:hypothetical protein LTR10_003213 [Elasticomyces elasticus]|nr:hypothetical protein LTR10_003213 [Elasticomyces elasticus]KAK4969484.1 hypothetical protein LTR42_008755 [Elasticomyces elasticus]
MDGTATNDAIAADNVITANNAIAASSTIGFLDLPPEIRNIVYGLALHHEEPLQLDGDPPQVVNYIHDEPYRFLDDDFEPPHLPTPYLNVSLLLVSRQVYAEAVPMLYGSNTIAFSARYTPSERPLYAFLLHIGTSRKYLRRIKVRSFGNYSTVRSALHLLKDSKQLDSFECSSDMLYKLNYAPGRVKSFVPWLRTLKKAATADPECKGALEILRLNPHEESFTLEAVGGQAVFDQRLADRQEKQKQIMAKLAKELA